jgi:hypothetical protein
LNGSCSPKGECQASADDLRNLTYTDSIACLISCQVIYIPIFISRQHFF